MGDLGERIWQARTDGRVLSPSETTSISSRADAYAVQADGVAASGMTRGGWKVAATNPAAQKMLGVDGPAMGPVFAEDIHDSPYTGSVIADHNPAMECEIAFFMGSDLSADDSKNRDAVLAATASAVTAIEMVGRRFDLSGFTAGEHLCIADFAFNAFVVKGASIDGWRDRDLAAVTAKSIINGEVVNEGQGSNVLGDPVNALMWAAEESASIGLPLRAGDIISTGTMTGAAVVAPGDHVVGDFGELGKIEIQV